MAGVALGDICLRFTWQAWHLAWHVATSAFVLRGRRGTYGTGLALVARLGVGDAAALLRCRRGTWRHLPSFHVTGVALGVALGDICMGLAWQEALGRR